MTNKTTLTPPTQVTLSPEDKDKRIKSLLKNMPTLPGVYKMLGKNREILYVGKAKSLKNRVSNYFIKTIDHPKTRALVSRIHSIETIITRSETEALLLEQNLIKEHRPPYNVMLRDDKSYLYIFMSTDKPFPRLAMGRGKRNHKKGRFFGPFPSAQSARETLELLEKLFKVRQCENTFFRQRTRPCLQYQIKRCKAPCVDLVSADEYGVDVDNTLRFLRGDSGELDKQLIEQMESAAEQLNFEAAAMFRDQLSMLRDVQAKQAVYTVGGDADVIAIAREAGVVCVHMLTVRGGRVLGGKHFYPDLDVTDCVENNLADFVASFYFQVSDDLPKEIITNMALPDASAITDALRQHYEQAVEIKHRVRETRAEWRDLAVLNAHNALKTQLADYLEIHARFQQLEDVLERKVDRIECFDISHTMGEATIASCVVFDQGGARKRDYRQYAIHGVQDGDDYAAMAQALTRRYKKQPLPDMLLIDGGKGQLNTAVEVMSEMDLLADAFLVGVSKGEGRKAGLETLHFTDGTKKSLPTDSKALHLIQHVRDEAHRFAITKHRAKRDKRRSSSVLEVIPGLGEKRRRDLLNHFGGIQGVLKASQDELTQVDGLGNVLAKTIYKALHE